MGKRWGRGDGFHVDKGVSVRGGLIEQEPLSKDLTGVKDQLRP